MRRLVLDYAAQHDLAEADTALVDIGWTGRMAASLIGVCEAAGMSRPHVLFWGHEPRPATGWTDPERVGSFVYNTATAQGLGWRVPDTPSWTRSGATRTRPRRTPREPIPTTATRPGPRYVRWPGHSRRMAGLPAAIVHGSRDHSP